MKNNKSQLHPVFTNILNQVLAIPRAEPQWQRFHVCVRFYGCVQCQIYHYEGDQLFTPHILWQSKHGIQEIMF